MKDDYKAAWHNCEIFAPDGTRIGICSKSRHIWYLKNELADEIGEKSIKLRFKPNYRNPNAPQRIVIKATRCVACGTTDNLKKFHIVPTAYKKYFPIERKSHVSNDIVLLCEYHTQDANQLANIYHGILKEQYNIQESDFTDVDKSKLKAACISYLKCIKRYNTTDMGMINKYVPVKIVDTLIKYLGENYTLEQIKSNENSDTSRKIDDCSTSYEYIAKKATENNISEFIMNWKEMFAENMEFKYIDDDYYDDTIGYV